MKLFTLAAVFSIALFAAGFGAAQVNAQTPADATSSPDQLQEEPTEAPVPTEAPIDEEPTEAPAATDVPADEGEVSEPTAEGSSDDNGDDNTNTWLIIGAIIVAIILLVAVGGLIFGRGGSGDKPKPTAGWDARASETYGKAAALHDSIAVELASTTPVSDDPAARQRWQDIQRRIDDLTADLHVLETQPKNEQAAATLRQLFATLTALRSSTLATTPTEPPVPGQPAPSEQLAGLIRQRLQDFDGDVRAFRTLL